MPRARSFAWYPTWVAAAFTASTRCCAGDPYPPRTRPVVATETPATRATSRMLGRVLTLTPPRRTRPHHHDDGLAQTCVMLTVAEARCLGQEVPDPLLTVAENVLYAQYRSRERSLNRTLRWHHPRRHTPRQERP